jgi:hypothetical protein
VTFTMGYTSSVAVLWKLENVALHRTNNALQYILVTVCTDIVAVRIRMAYSNCTVATVHIGNSVH